MVLSSRVSRVSWVTVTIRVVGLALWLVSGLALTKYRCEFDNLNCIFVWSDSTCTASRRGTPASCYWPAAASRRRHPTIVSRSA